MFIGDILVAHKLVSPEDIAAALERQKVEGGRLGDILVAQGKLSAEALENVMHGAPQAPRSLAETGLGLQTLLGLLVKAMYAGAAETPSGLANFLKLPHRCIQLIIEQAQERKLLETLGAAGSADLAEVRYALGEKGRRWALDALGQNQYIGPVPVSLPAYIDRIRRQRITNERVDRPSIEDAFANMIVSPTFVQQIGPAINSGRSILLYGAPGNGKTSIAETIGRIFANIIYIPHCFEVEGQIIKVFDPGIHRPVESTGADSRGTALRREDFDRRWVPCSRPFIVTGGELTLEMLDLSFNAIAKFYEAPLHIKALGGTFVIDDFGRQIVKPEALLNRWIVPMEKNIDFLSLHTGRKIEVPFAVLIVFSTNLPPRDL
ncbi:MAG: hypothetical protein KIT16_13660, partial [Rhodospirillaceae bacterium]|nr:hypothetical protein [Rhodospirillaceae bacterium]